MKMDKEKELPQRKSTRLKSFDYSSSGAYFITICTESRRQILSRIVGGDVLDAPKKVELLPYGKIAEKYIKQLNDFYDNVRVDRYVIMPNHVHLIIRIENDGGRTLFAPTISRIIKQFKGVTTKEIGKSIWQKGFYDHVIRDCHDYNIRWQYIDDNPSKWLEDELYHKD